MTANLALGSLLISATVLIHTVGLIALSRTMERVIRWWRLHRHAPGKAIAMVATVLGLFLVHTVEVWMWAAAYFILAPIHSFADSLYFSTVTFSTIGYGDITLGPDWRLLASLEGINGMLLIGWSTAYLVSASTRYGPFRLGEHF
jgi:voltage-gated potassium channel Kch